MTKWQWILLQKTRELWVQATLIGLMGVGAAILATLADHFIPWQLPLTIDADAVDSILTIIASSMLAVTTFSLSVMVSAYGSATSNVTPRATRLLMQDKLTQSVLSTFLGSFLFSIVGIIVLKTGAYGEQGRSVLFLVTIAVIILVVVALLRWINHLLSFGRVGETTNRVERVAREAITERLNAPFMGGRCFNPESDALINCNNTVYSERIGYVQHIDMQALSACANAMNTDIYVRVLPGTFVYADTSLASFAAFPAADEEPERNRYQALVYQAFTIAKERSFDQDPRFGITVLNEVGVRALSSAINDPGTIIDVIGRCTRLLSLWASESRTPKEEEISYPRVHVMAINDADLLDDAFRQFGRDGAGLLEVQIRLQKSLQALSRIGSPAFRAAARYQSQLALQRAEQALLLEEEKAVLRELAASVSVAE